MMQLLTLVHQKTVNYHKPRMMQSCRYEER